MADRAETGARTGQRGAARDEKFAARRRKQGCGDLWLQSTREGNRGFASADSGAAQVSGRQVRYSYIGHGQGHANWALDAGDLVAVNLGLWI